MCVLHGVTVVSSQICACAFPLFRSPTLIPIVSYYGRGKFRVAWPSSYIRDCLSIVGRGRSAATKHGQVRLPHIACVFRMRHLVTLQPLIPSISCLCQGK